MSNTLDEQVQAAFSWIKALRSEIGQVIVGQEQLVDRLLVGLLAFFLPESPRFMAAGGRPRGKIVAALTRIAPDARAEIEAEAVAFVVLANLGIDSSAYSAGYLSTWIGEHGDVGEAISRSCTAISAASQRILSTIELDPARLVDASTLA